MIELAVFVALATLAVGLVVAIALRQLPTVRLQLAGLALLAVVLPLAVVLLSGWVMFHMGDDVKILAVAAASASTSVIVALLVSRPIAREIEAARNTAAPTAADAANAATARIFTSSPMWNMTKPDTKTATSGTMTANNASPTS